MRSRSSARSQLLVSESCRAMHLRLVESLGLLEGAGDLVSRL